LWNEHFLSSIYTGCILEFLEKVTKEVDSGKPFDIIFLDFAKAFDKVLEMATGEAESL
jgi:hypothetical protein